MKKMQSLFSKIRDGFPENVNDLYVMLHCEIKAEVLIQAKNERVVWFTGKVICLQKALSLEDINLSCCTEINLAEHCHTVVIYFIDR